MTIAGGRLSIIQKFYSELDDDFKSVLENDRHAQSMYELLKLPNAHVISPFILAVLRHYDKDEKYFRFGEKKLTIKLEDVLYITGLPIYGKPVIYDGTYKDTFLHIFPSITFSYLKRQNRITMDELRGIAKNTKTDEVQRKRAVLLTLAYNIITPSADGHGVPPNLTPFFDDVEDVDNYAWGVSLLSILYSLLICFCTTPANLLRPICFFSSSDVFLYNFSKSPLATLNEIYFFSSSMSCKTYSAVCTLPSMVYYQQFQVPLGLDAVQNPAAELSPHPAGAT